MSVDYYVCKRCGRTFPDCGYFVSCERCGEHWCSDECAEEDGFRVEIDNDAEYSTSCNFCREEDFDDSDLLAYALFAMNKTREELIEDYMKSTFNDEETQ